MRRETWRRETYAGQRLGGYQNGKYLSSIWVHEMLLEHRDATEQLRHNPDKEPRFLREFLRRQQEWEPAA